SQCLYAGGWPMRGGSEEDRTSPWAWWYGKITAPPAGTGEGVWDQLRAIKHHFFQEVNPSRDERYAASASWAGVDALFKHLQVTGRGVLVSEPRYLEKGDVVQIYNRTQGRYVHSTLVTRNQGGELYLSYHSHEVLNIRLKDFRARIGDDE